MRYVLVLIFGFTMSALSQSLTNEVMALKLALASKNSEVINQALIGLQGAINQHEFIDRSPWKSPSLEKQQRRAEIKSALQPIMPDLSKLLTADNPTLASNSAVILGFSDGDSQVYGSLKKSLQESPYNSVVSSSAYSIFQLGLADASVKAVIVERLQEYQSENKRDVAFGLLNLASAWQIPEALPVIIEVLKSNEQIGAKMVAINALIRLGPQAKEALPEIEKILRELEQQGGDFRDVNTIKQAIMLIGGKGDEEESANSPAVRDVQTMPVPALAEPVGQRKLTGQILLIVTETKSFPLQGIIGAILLIAVVGGILFKFLRR
jgi:hypothetical protein